MERLAWICLAGAVGTGTRYLLGLWAHDRFGPAFPYGTLLVNVLGCFLIGAVFELAIRLGSFPATLRVALTTGFLGGLTTYSSFAYETGALFTNGARWSALLNFVVTTVLCFAALFGGLAAARALVRT